MANNRQSKRIPFVIDVEIVAGTNTFKGTTKNISLHGFYVQFKSDMEMNNKEFSRSSKIVLKLEFPSGEAHELICESRWMMFTMNRGIRMNQLGLQIIDPPQTFQEFVNGLS